MTVDLSPAAQSILTVVETHRTGTSMVEIVNALRADGHNPDGDLALEHPNVPNLYMWFGVNQLVLDAFNELLAARLIHYRPTEVLVYLADGAMPNVPVVRRPPKAGYKEPHWMPTAINAGPAPTE